MLAIFNSLGGGEVIAILIIGLIVLGPEKLPDAIRKFGNIYGEFRRMSQGFQSELRDAFDEPLQSLRGTAQMMQDSVNQPLQAITDMTAPVVGGAATAEPVEVTATEVADADGGRPTAATVAEARPSRRCRLPSTTTRRRPARPPRPGPPSRPTALSGQRSRAGQRRRIRRCGHPGAGAATPAVEVEAEPDVREDEEPVLAEAGLLLSEPEMPTESSEDEERPG